MYGLTDYEIVKEITRLSAPNASADLQTLPYTPTALLSRLLINLRQHLIVADDLPCEDAQPALADCE